ncbi:MAG TPA: porphobilinogen synthase, partial [Chthoniobacterales bacterium]|nr:porphobilinogen synthase [Chthoniobacterales bacterium]
MEYNSLPPLTSHLSPGLASQGLLRRMRRNRATPAIRALVQETKLHREDLIQPLFFHGGSGGLEEIGSMPGVMRHTLLSLVEECRLLVDLGIPAVAIFPCIDPSYKEPKGEHALNPGNVLYAAIRAIKTACPHLAVIADVALDPYTSHGHDGLLNAKGSVENDSTVELLARLAVAEAEAGADVVAPSDMMDGRVMAIRLALDEKKLQHVGIMAYSAKYASAYYGPFREAVGSKSSKALLDKSDYQMNPANLR